MVSAIALLGAIAVLIFVFYWSGRYGGRGTVTGTSLRRGPRAHTTSRGRPKVGYDKREEAEARARHLSTRDGAPMNVYQCGECAKWHVGHGR